MKFERQTEASSKQGIEEGVDVDEGCEEANARNKTESDTQSRMRRT